MSVTSTPLHIFVIRYTLVSGKTNPYAVKLNEVDEAELAKALQQGWVVAAVTPGTTNSVENGSTFFYHLVLGR